MRGNTYAFHSSAAINKIWHFHPKPSRWLFQDPVVAGLASGGASRHTCSWWEGIELLHWHPSGSLVFSAVGCEIWCLFFYWGKGGHRRPLERHKLRFYFSYIKGRGFYVWASTCSGEDNQLFLYKLQAYAKKLNMLCYLWDLFSCLSAAILWLIRLLSVLDAFMIFISSFVC